MSLNSTNFINMGPIKSADMKQFVDLFTGVMIDQPVTFKNALLVGGNQGTSTPPVKVSGAVGQTGNLLEMYPTAASATPTFAVSGLGGHSWGPGSPATADTFMSRVAMQNGHATDTAGLLISPYLEVIGTIRSDGFSFANQATLLAPGASPFLLQINQNLATNGWTQQTEIATPSTPPAGQVKIYPKASRHLYILDSAGVESDLLGVGNVVVNEDFLPANAVTQITVTQVPSSVIMVSRNGVVQSDSDGHYSRAGQVFTFSTAFDGNDRVEISYATGGVLGIAPDGSVTNQMLASDTTRHNLLPNGGFEVWTYTPILPVVGQFTPSGLDPWQVSNSGLAGMIAARDSVNADGSGYCMAVTATGQQSVYQLLPSYAQFSGRTITFACRVKTSVAGKARIRLDNGGTTVYSPFHTGSGAYETLTVTFAVPAGATRLNASLDMDASGVYYFDNATLVFGGIAAAYAPALAVPDVVPNGRLGSDTARANLLTNGGMEIWQRGAGPFAVAAYGPDRWFTDRNGTSTVTVNRAANSDAGVLTQYMAEINYTHAAGGNASFIQMLVDGVSGLNRRLLTFSARVYANSANNVRLLMTDGTNFSYSVYHPGGSAWVTLWCSIRSTTVASISVRLLVDGSTDTVRIHAAMLVSGDAPADYVPLHPADDFARCLRYYEASATMFANYGVAGSQFECWTPFKALKPNAPSITLTGSTPTNMNAPSATFTTIAGTDVYATVTATGVGKTSVTYIAESNP